MNFFETLAGYQRANIAALDTIIGDKIYPVEAPQTVTAPYCVFEQVSGRKDVHHGGKSGWGEMRVSYDFYATEQHVVMDAADALSEAFEGVTVEISDAWQSVKATAESEFTSPRSEDGLYRRHIDLVFTYNTK